MCDVTLPAILITCQILFCGTKKIKRRFYCVKKKIYLSFLWNISYFLVFLCSFIIPFTDDSFSFQKSFFDFLLLLIVDPCHTFSRLLMTTIRGVCGHIKASWDNHSNCLSCSSCSMLSTCSVCKTRTADLIMGSCRQAQII